MKPAKKKDKPLGEPALEFRYCAKQCFACDRCGYFWTHSDDVPIELRGKPARFGVASRLEQAS